jgi:hypothetical protein
MDEALEVGLPTKEKLQVELLKSGDWTPAHENQLKKLASEIDYIGAEIKMAEFNIGRKNILKKRLERVSRLRG